MTSEGGISHQVNIPLVLGLLQYAQCETNLRVFNNTSDVLKWQCTAELNKTAPMCWILDFGLIQDKLPGGIAFFFFIVCVALKRRELLNKIDKDKLSAIMS